MPNLDAKYLETLYREIQKRQKDAVSVRALEVYLKEQAALFELSGDALRARLRRYLKPRGIAYPRQRQPGAFSRAATRKTRRAAIDARLDAADVIRAKGGSWVDVARAWGIKTGAGARQCYLRHRAKTVAGVCVEGVS